jgi:hypothetical protein
MSMTVQTETEVTAGTHCVRFQSIRDGQQQFDNVYYYYPGTSVLVLLTSNVHINNDTFGQMHEL